MRFVRMRDGGMSDRCGGSWPGEPLGVTPFRALAGGRGLQRASPFAATHVFPDLTLLQGREPCQREPPRRLPEKEPAWRHKNPTFGGVARSMIYEA